MANTDSNQLHSHFQLYPWQQEQFNFIRNLYKSNKLSKVILMHGTKGIGKNSFALTIANLIASNNLNINIVGNNDDKINTKISIEDIRSLIDKSSYSIDNNRVFILNNIDLLNTSSANALLKTLETDISKQVSTGSNYYILTADHIQQVLPTIVSRSYKVNLNISANSNIILDYLSKHGLSDYKSQEILLELANNGPLLALEFLHNDYLNKIKQVEELINDLTSIKNNLIDIYNNFINNFFAKSEKLTKQKNTTQNSEKKLDNKDKNKDKMESLKEFVFIINYIITKSYISNGKVNKININYKNFFYIINKYNNLVLNNITIDHNNAVFKILYSIYQD